MPSIVMILMNLSTNVVRSMAPWLCDQYLRQSQDGNILTFIKAWKIFSIPIYTFTKKMHGNDSNEHINLNLGGKTQYGYVKIYNTVSYCLLYCH